MKRDYPLSKTPEPKQNTDSTAYYRNKEKTFRQLAKSEKGNSEISKFNKNFFEIQAGKATSNKLRQYHKGKPGFDSYGFPKNKK